MDSDFGPISYSQFGCIGSGFSAIAVGAQLQRWYGLKDIRFFEKEGDLGGTWFVNSYPGCACDIPGVLYCLSFEQNPEWSRMLPSHHELWGYLKRVADKYDLTNRMTFGVQVERCEWIERTKRWRMYNVHHKTGQRFIHECQILFGAVGQLTDPKLPDVPGIETFGGDVFHASRWRHDVDLTDKKVAVVGNGCTGAQIVPAIAKRTQHTTHFSRSKHWVVPPVDKSFGDPIRTIFRNFPPVLALARAFVAERAEADFAGFHMNKRGAAFRKRKQKIFEKYMRDTAPAEYHDLLIPDFEVGCKRRIFDPGYLKSLHAENVTLTNEGILEVLPDGLRTTKGFVPIDVLVLAIGFNTGKLMPGLEIIGRNGSLKDHWEEYGGPEAYNCTLISDFPNFFQIWGPNAATGHTSAVLAIENAVNFSLRLLKPIIEGKASVVEVKREAEERYVNDLQSNFKGTVWLSGCISWYIKPNKNGEYWNSHMYPWGQLKLWWDSVFVRWNDMNYEWTEKVKQTSWLGKLVKLLAYTCMITFAMDKSGLAKKLLGRDVPRVLPIVKSMLANLGNP